MTRNIEDILAGLDTGKIPAHLTDEVEAWLFQRWDSLAGGADTKMAAHKLLRGIEDLSWEPPVLTFRIERHGGTVGGSTRAEMQGWAIDTHASTATAFSAGHRQLYQAAARLDVKPLAAEIARMITEGSQDPRLSWKNANHAVLRISEIIPETNKQTTTGRRRRFRAVLDLLLREAGWEMTTITSVKRVVASGVS